MPVLIFPKRLDFEQKAYSRTASYEAVAGRADTH